MSSGYDYKKGLDEYEKSVEKHIENVNAQLDEQLAEMKQKLHDKNGKLKQMEIDNELLEKETEKMEKKIRLKTKKLVESNKQNLQNVEKAEIFEAQIRDVQEKMPIKMKTIEEILLKLNEKRRFVAEKQRELSTFRINRTEQSLKTNVETSKKKLEEMRVKKIAQDKRILRLRSDISRSEKSFDTLEKEIHNEFHRQLESESKKEEVERRVKIFEIENFGVADEFKNLLLSLNEGRSTDETEEEKRKADIELLLSKGKRYLEKLENKIQQLRSGEDIKEHGMKMVGNSAERGSEKSQKVVFEESKKSHPTEKLIWKKIDNMKREIIQLKREHEALISTKRRLKTTREELEKQLEDEQKKVDKAAFELRNAENVRIAELNEKDRKLKPSVLVESKEEKTEKEKLRKAENLKERLAKLEKDNEQRKKDLDKILKRNEILRRKLQSNGEVDVVSLENDKIRKCAEIRNLKKKWHENVMQMNALHKKLQQRVLQREAAMTRANSVVHLTTNIREERKREIKQLKQQIQETKSKFNN